MNNTIIKIPNARTGLEGTVQYYKMADYLWIMRGLDRKGMSDDMVYSILNSIENISKRTVLEYICTK